MKIKYVFGTILFCSLTIPISINVPALQASNSNNFRSSNNASENSNTDRSHRERRIVYVVPRMVDDSRKRVINVRGTATRNSDPNMLDLNFPVIIAPKEIANTISARPQFLVYLPKGSKISMLLEEKGPDFNKKIWEQNFQVTSTGITKVTLPKNTEGLEVGKEYRLLVNKVVSDDDRSADIIAQVWLKRVEIEDSDRALIKSAENLVDRAAILAGLGLWYDTTALLADNQNSGSIDLLGDLLKQVDLSELTNQKIVNSPVNTDRS